MGSLRGGLEPPLAAAPATVGFPRRWWQLFAFVFTSGHNGRVSESHTCALLQYDVVKGEVARNEASIHRLLDKIPGSRPLIALVPEAATSNFSHSKADEIAGETWEAVQRLSERCRAEGFSLYGSFVVKDGDGFFNEGLLLRPDGTKEVYRKVHLFEPAGEHTFYREGTGQVVADLGEGLRAGLTICYDLRFPEWVGKLVEKGANALFCVAQWPEPRREHWDTLLKARAIENLCWVAAVNRTGEGPKDRFNGGSAIYSPWGERVAFVPDNEEGIACAVLDLGTVADARHRLPTLGRRFRNG